MDQSVTQRLLDLNSDFYRAHAGSFDESRQGGWDSWNRVLDEVLHSGPRGDLLDLGCGNGRFASLLDEREAGIRYTGVDAEEQLLRAAERRHPDKQFSLGTIAETLAWTERFDVVVAFGVFHHLPGAQLRGETLAGLARLLRPAGRIALSLWQPKLLDNFASKVYPDVEIGTLEENDFLLGWNGDFTRPRYCHHFDDDEIDRLVAVSGLDVVANFQGSGNDRTNRYVVLTPTR